MPDDLAITLTLAEFETFAHDPAALVSAMQTRFEAERATRAAVREIAEANGAQVEFMPYRWWSSECVGAWQAARITLHGRPGEPAFSFTRQFYEGAAIDMGKFLAGKIERLRVEADLVGASADA